MPLTLAPLLLEILPTTYSSINTATRTLVRPWTLCTPAASDSTDDTPIILILLLEVNDLSSFDLKSSVNKFADIIVVGDDRCLLFISASSIMKSPLFAARHMIILSDNGFFIGPGTLLCCMSTFPICIPS